MASATAPGSAMATEQESDSALESDPALESVWARALGPVSVSVSAWAKVPEWESVWESAQA